VVYAEHDLVASRPAIRRAPETKHALWLRAGEMRGAFALAPEDTRCHFPNAEWVDAEILPRRVQPGMRTAVT